MTGRYVALIRGINVGKAKRVGMAELRAGVESLGYTDVRTLLNSGNVVFTAGGRARDARDVGARIETVLATRIGVPARVIVLSAGELATVVAENALRDVATNPSRLLVTVLADPADRARLEPLTREQWAPEALALGTRATYVWCPDGLLASPLSQAVGRALGDAATARNWSTITKLQAMM